MARAGTEVRRSRASSAVTRDIHATRGGAASEGPSPTLRRWGFAGELDLPPPPSCPPSPLNEVVGLFAPGACFGLDALPSSLECAAGSSEATWNFARSGVGRARLRAQLQGCEATRARSFELALEAAP